MNTHLTTQAHVPLSHIDYGWEHITDRIVAQLSHEKKNIVFILWGKHAQEKMDLIDKSKHYVLTAAHPSPLSAYRGFFGSGCFTLCNTALLQEGKTPIDWNS